MFAIGEEIGQFALLGAGRSRRGVLSAAIPQIIFFALVNA